jgi:gentisate 1,2-dioxygenase
LTGGSTMPTIMCRMHRLPAGRRTKRNRRTSNTIYHVVRGTGVTLAGTKELVWTKGDIFVIPSWTDHHHLAADQQDAILFTATDEPVHRALGLFSLRDAD